MTLIAVSIGCPAGIGPEVSVAAARDARAAVLLVGDARVLERAGAKTLIPVDDGPSARRLRPGQLGWWRPSASLPSPPPFGRPRPLDGEAQLAWINAACDLAQYGVCDALVTGPASKSAIACCGARGARRFTGHTEHLARRLGREEVVMAFWSKKLAVALVTTHVPLKSVSRALTIDKVAATCYWLGLFLEEVRSRAHIVVAGVNPHAGEKGLLGDEEPLIIKPGITQARRRLRGRAKLVGPVGAETAFRQAADGMYEGVVAMYHDQATIPCKLLGFGDMVNLTLGLPIVRTSVDHGTAYDIAGTGRANADGMRAAIRLARKLTQLRAD